MNRLKFLGLALLLTLAVSPLSAMTLDEVIEKHIEARGGQESWSAVQSMTLEGTFHSFSKVGPFTLHRSRDNHYYLDHIFNGRRTFIGYDGETPWWIHPMRGGAWPQRITGIDQAVLMQKLDFESPFFDYAKKGYQVELLENGDLEGQEALRLKLVRTEGGDEETWYLDPDTYLEMGFDATGSDFGAPRPQRTFFDDYREVNGVQIPFYSEAQWYTRLRIFEVENITINPEIDSKIFSMPIPEGMDALPDLTGDWKVAVEQQAFPGGPWTQSERTSSMTSRLRGAILEESYVDENSSPTVRQITWDSLRKQYQITHIDDGLGMLDVQRGGAMEEGKLVVSNAETGTPLKFDETLIHLRTTYSEISTDGFKVEIATSQDGGQNWAPTLRMTYSRPE